MKQFIKIKAINGTTLINTTQIISIDPYGETAFAIAVRDATYIVNIETYEAIMAHLADDVADLTPPKDDNPNKANEDTMKLFDILTGEHATEVLKNEFEEICTSREFWLWTYYKDELLDAIHKYIAKYGTGYIVYDLFPNEVEYEKLIGLLAKHWGLERDDD